MLPDADGLPLVEPTAKGLGVRQGEIRVDSRGEVEPGTEGMSVAPTWRQLPSHRIPKRLRHLCDEATGPNKTICFDFGDGPFTAGPFAADLLLRPNEPNHAFVEPARTMQLRDYEAALASTRLGWQRNEE